MIRLPYVVCFLSLLAFACSGKQQSTPLAHVSLIKADTAQVEVDFHKDVQPILEAHCTPCHFPSGKMYVKMPFDKPQTIRDHTEGIFKRIKDPAEVMKLKAFLGQKPG